MRCHGDIAVWQAFALGLIPMLSVSAFAQTTPSPASTKPTRSVTKLDPRAFHYGQPNSAPSPEPKPQESAPLQQPQKVLPISLDAIFRLAEQQNAQIGVARARVQEASAAADLAAQGWLPSLYVGAAYYRHEGGIANEDGTLTHSSFSSLFGGLEITSKLDLKEFAYQKVSAERALWQREGELSKITHETVLEAAETYIDMLAAHEGEIIALNLQKDLEDLVKRAQDRVMAEPGAAVEVPRIQAQLYAVQQRIVQLRARITQASAKLAYLLGIDPTVTLVPVDERLVPLELVNAAVPVENLVGQVLSNGPGVREMQGLLSLIHESIDKSNGPGKYLPIFELRAAEGGFGTGPGDSQTWDNRFDLGLQARWNLTELFTSCERQRILHAKTAQAHLAYDDLQGKLTAGVQESREAILLGRDQIRLGQSAIDQSREAHRLSDERLKHNVAGSSPSEVLLTLQSTLATEASYINAVRDFDRAELRLLLLLGPVNGHLPQAR
jgi:outer membrane protein TolC